MDIVNMIQIEALSKQFKGHAVVDNLSLTIPTGEITALVGANGCGKTTLMRLISGMLRPDSGSIQIGPDHKLGVLLGGEVHLYEKLSGYENLCYFGMLRHLSKAECHARCRTLAEALNFQNFMHERTEIYSRGMKQRIAFAIALLHNPDILLLDEPSTGLDILAASDVLHLMRDCQSQGKTVLISTHNIAEIADLSDNIAIMNQGKIQRFEASSSFFAGCEGAEKLRKLVRFLECGTR